MTLKRGDMFIAFPVLRPAERLYGQVKRVARDGSWADVDLAPGRWHGRGECS